MLMLTSKSRDGAGWVIVALQGHSDQLRAGYDQLWAGAVTINNSTLVISRGITKAETTLPTFPRRAVRGKRALRYQSMSWCFYHQLLTGPW